MIFSLSLSLSLDLDLSLSLARGRQVYEFMRLDHTYIEKKGERLVLYMLHMAAKNSYEF